MVSQKRDMLQRLQTQAQQAQEKRQRFTQEIKNDSQELSKIEEEIKQNEDLQIQDAQRDEYLKIKSQLEQDNAQIGRQIGLVEQKLGYQNQKRANLYAQIVQLKS